MEVPVFEQVGEAVRAAVPPDLGAVHTRSHSAGVKVWFGPGPVTRDHYEAQLMRRSLVDGGDGVALEIGFHAEHPKEADNEAVLARLLAERAKWSRTLGRDAHAGEFLGRSSWRRLSEVWLDPDLSQPDAVLEIADRLATYIRCIEAIRRR